MPKCRASNVKAVTLFQNVTELTSEPARPRRRRHDRTQARREPVVAQRAGEMGHWLPAPSHQPNLSHLYSGKLTSNRHSGSHTFNQTCDRVSNIHPASSCVRSAGNTVFWTGEQTLACIYGFASRET